MNLAVSALAGFTILAQVPAAECPSDTSGALAQIGDATGQASQVAQGPMQLSELVAMINASPEGRQALANMIAGIARETGLELPQEQLAQITLNPQRVEDLLTVRVRDIVTAFATLQTGAELRNADPPEPLSFVLPSGVKLEDAPSYFSGELGEPQPVIGDMLYYGDRPLHVDPSVVQERRAFGEILDQLSRNAGKADADKWNVVYHGKPYTDVESFLGALRHHGHQITASVTQGIANFIDILVKQPDGSFRDVLTPLRIKTSFITGDGREIVVPSVHSGLKLRVSGPDVNAVTSFYQGVGGTRFFASELTQDQSWVGRNDVETFHGARAIQAAGQAAIWMDLINGLVESDALMAGGYGQTGVCNDSVAVIQQLLTGRTTIYPLTMDKTRVLPYLDSLIESRPELADRYRAVRSAVEALPFDADRRADQPGRILQSIPFPPGTTVHRGANDARATFSASK